MATAEEELEQLLGTRGLKTEGYSVTIGGDNWGVHATVYYDNVRLERRSVSGWRKYQRASRWALRVIDDHRKAQAALGELTS